MSPTDGQATLALQQEKLVRTLLGNGSSPEGFDSVRLGAAAAALARKRARAVAQAWPGLTLSLGNSFVGRFAAFAHTTPLPRDGGPLADGRAFARALAADGTLDDAGRLEALAVDARYSTRASGLVPRRGLAIKAARLPGRGRLVVAIRLPWRLGEWWFSMRGWANRSNIRSVLAR